MQLLDVKRTLFLLFNNIISYMYMITLRQYCSIKLLSGYVNTPLSYLRHVHSPIVFIKICITGISRQAPHFNIYPVNECFWKIVHTASIEFRTTSKEKRQGHEGKAAMKSWGWGSSKWRGRPILQNHRQWIRLLSIRWSSHLPYIFLSLLLL